MSVLHDLKRLSERVGEIETDSELRREFRSLGCTREQMYVEEKARLPAVRFCFTMPDYSHEVDSAMNMWHSLIFDDLMGTQEHDFMLWLKSMGRKKRQTHKRMYGILPKRSKS